MNFAVSGRGWPLFALLVLCIPTLEASELQENVCLSGVCLGMSIDALSRLPLKFAPGSDRHFEDDPHLVPMLLGRTVAREALVLDVDLRLRIDKVDEFKRLNEVLSEVPNSLGVVFFALCVIPLALCVVFLAGAVARAELAHQCLPADRMGGPREIAVAVGQPGV